MTKLKRDIELLNSISQKYAMYPEDYEEIKGLCAKKLFSKSKNGSTYGMFFPCSEMNEHFVYKGKLVGEKAKYDNEYCFDINDRLLATKFVREDIENNEYIFFFYGETYVDYIRVGSRDGLKGCGRYEKENGTLTRLIECQCFYESGKINQIEEYLFGVKRGCLIYNKYFTGILGMQDSVQTDVLSRVFGV